MNNYYKACVTVILCENFINNFKIRFIINDYALIIWIVKHLLYLYTMCWIIFI